MFEDFLEGLDRNVEKIIAESAPVNEAMAKRTIKDLGATGRYGWIYVPKPKDATESDLKKGTGGFGPNKRFTVAICQVGGGEDVENSKWDIVSFAPQMAADGVEDDSIGKAVDAAKKGTENFKKDLAKPTGESVSKEMERLINLTEQFIGEGANTLNESSEVFEPASWNAAIEDTKLKAVSILKDMKYREVVEKCLAIAHPEMASGTSVSSLYTAK